MPVRKKFSRTVVAHNSAYIDPLDCDSTVSYKVIDRPGRTTGSVQLADCSRKIEWYFNGDENPVKKIDKAIEMLEEFRKAFTGAQRARRTRKPKAKLSATA
jgi:hypothetical protein